MGTLLSITAEKYQFTAAVNDNLTTVNGYFRCGKRQLDNGKWLLGCGNWLLSCGKCLLLCGKYLLESGIWILTCIILIICHFLQVAEHKTAAQGPAHLGLTPQLYRYLIKLHRYVKISTKWRDTCHIQQQLRVTFFFLVSFQFLIQS